MNFLSVVQSIRPINTGVNSFGNISLIFTALNLAPNALAALARIAYKLKVHEYTVRIWAVAAERARRHKAFAAVQVVCRLKCRVCAGLQAESHVFTLPGNRDEVLKHCAPCTSAARSQRCAHGLDFTVRWRQLFQRAAAQLTATRLSTTLFLVNEGRRPQNLAIAGITVSIRIVNRNLVCTNRCDSSFANFGAALHCL